MALHRGIQSAIFYYLSCAPCTEARLRKKRRREADLAKLEKEAIEAESARLDYQYKHTLASNTNPAWDLEIAIGPSRESKAAAKLKAKRDKDCEPPPRSSGSTTTISDRTKQTAATASPDVEHQARVQWASTFQRNYSESTIKVPERTHTDTSRRSRADPSLPALSPSVSRTATSTWSSPPNPPLNDLHPPTVTRYDSPEDISWMLAPPPPVRVMRGQEPERRAHYSPRTATTSNATRSRAGTGASASSTKAISGNVVNDPARHLEQRDSVTDDEHPVEGISGSEKRDSAGPAPGRNMKGGYLFPPRDWLDQAQKRETIGGDGAGDEEEDDDDDHSPSRDRIADNSRPRPIRWRWSIDW